MARKAHPYIDRNDRGIWEVRWSVAGRNKRLSLKTRDFRVAQDGFVEWLFERWSRGDAERPSISEILDTYIAERLAEKPSLRDRTASVANVKAHFGQLEPAGIAPACVIDYIAARRSGAIGSKPARDGTIAKELSILTTAIRHLIRTKRLPANDMPYIPKPEPEGPRERWLTQWEAVVVMAEADSGRRDLEKPWGLTRLGLFVRIALATGARREAIETLAWDQVHLSSRLIHFNPPGRRQTKKRRPIVPISNALHAVLLEERQIARTPYVLGAPMTIRKRFDRLARRIGLHEGGVDSGNTVPHTLRHTWATWAAQAGVSLYDIARTLGDTVATVERNYAHHAPEYLRGAIERGRVSNAAAVPAPMRPVAETPANLASSLGNSINLSP